MTAEIFPLTWEKSNPDYWTTKILKSKLANINTMYPDESIDFREWYRTAIEEMIDDALKVLAFKQQEMIMEIAKNLYVPRESNPKLLYTLFDKWNNKWTSDN